MFDKGIIKNWSKMICMTEKLFNSSIKQPLGESPNTLLFGNAFCDDARSPDLRLPALSVADEPSVTLDRTYSYQRSTTSSTYPVSGQTDTSQQPHHWRRGIY